MLRPAFALALCAFLFPASASAAPVVFSTGDLTTPTLDNGTVEIPLDATAGEILTARVKVNVSHPFDAALDLSLIAPDGTRVDLSSDNGGAGDNYGSGLNCSGGFTTFDDAAATAVTAGAAPFVGSYRPEGPLTGIAGKPLQGTWKLRVTDDDGFGDVGTVRCWQLEVVPAQADISVTSTDSPDPAVVGSNLVYTSVVTNAGPDRTSHVKLIDTLPGGVVLVSAVTPGGTCAGTADVVCDLRPLAAADQEAVTITVRPTAPGTLTNRVTVSQVADEPTGAVGAHIDFETTGVKAPDRVAPNTVIKLKPPLATRSRTARFTFKSTEPAGAKFQCKLDKGRWTSCASPKTYRKLKVGGHTFRVRAKDAAGNVDASPAKRTWRILPG